MRCDVSFEMLKLLEIVPHTSKKKYLIDIFSDEVLIAVIKILCIGWLCEG